MSLAFRQLVRTRPPLSQPLYVPIQKKVYNFATQPLPWSLHSHKRNLAMATTNTKHPSTKCPELEELYRGNQRFLAEVAKTDPGLLRQLADAGQSA